MNGPILRVAKQAAMEILPDPFPTTKLSVPNLAELVSRLRDPDIRRCVTIVHAKRDGEGKSCSDAPETSEGVFEQRTLGVAVGCYRDELVSDLGGRWQEQRRRELEI